MEAAPALDGDQRWRRPLLFEPISQRCDAHLADVRALSKLFDDGEAFLARELGDDRAVGSYRLRGSGLTVVVRHRSRDLGVLDEIFRRGFYELPLEVAAILARLGRPPRVVDVGANIGLFGAWFAERFPRARIAAFEPDRFNVELLRSCAAANRHAADWRLVEACAGDSDATVRFVAGDFSSSHVTTDEPGAVAVPQVDVFPELARADLAKLDAEGGEWQLLADPRLRESGPRTLALEYHPYLCPDDHPRTTAERLLEAAGFTSRQPLYERADGVGMLWAWKTAPDPLGVRVRDPLT